MHIEYIFDCCCFEYHSRSQLLGRSWWWLTSLPPGSNFTPYSLWMDLDNSRCGPCKMIAPVLEELSKTLEDVVFLKVGAFLLFQSRFILVHSWMQTITHWLKVDVDDVEEVAAEYKITAMPTFIFLKKNEQVLTFSHFSWRRKSCKRWLSWRGPMWRSWRSWWRRTGSHWTFRAKTSEMVQYSLAPPATSVLIALPC